jgi:hypothetical protein
MSKSAAKEVPVRRLKVGFQRLAFLGKRIQTWTHCRKTRQRALDKGMSPKRNQLQATTPQKRVKRAEVRCNPEAVFAVTSLREETGARTPAQPGLAGSDGRSLVVFGPRGFTGLCGCLVVLYGLGYSYLRPNGLPSFRIQLLKLGFYVVATVGLRLHEPQSPRPEAAGSVQSVELRRVLGLFISVIGGAFLLSVPMVRSLVTFAVVAAFVLWTPLGFVLNAITLAQPWRNHHRLPLCPDAA